MRKYLSKHSSFGFTLIEILVSIAIVSFISVAIISFRLSVLKGSASMQAGLISQQQVRKAFYQFVQEARSALSPTGGATLIEVATSSFTFYANVDKDAPVERVRYFMGTSTASTTMFYREVIEPVGGVYAHSNQELSTIINDIRATTTAIFTYYDTNYEGTSTPLVQPVTTTAVRLVKIILPIDPNAARSPIYQVYSTQVSLRNMKDNL